ncbi:MAG: 50S ribosomal protein L6 [Desulfohalobiaceae bacterium]
MSRIGKLPVEIPEDVQVDVQEEQIHIQGPKGSLQVYKHPLISYEQEQGKIYLRRKDNSPRAREQYGLRRTLLNNAVQGVKQGFEKGLELVGVGYKVQVQGQKVVLNVGYSQAQEFQLPQGIQARAEGNRLFVSGIDKEQVGEVAARIRKIRRPEPYKGKGIKYLHEELRRKAGKSAKKK